MIILLVILSFCFPVIVPVLVFSVLAKKLTAKQQLFFTGFSMFWLILVYSISII